MEKKIIKRLDIIHAIVVFVFLAAMVLVAIDRTLPPNSLPASVPATGFSAERAIEHILAIAQEPRISGSPGYKIARDYVMSELAELGLIPEIQNSTDVENIITRITGTHSQEAILLVAHLDSLNGPGATDNGSGVAVLLETARALQTGSPLRNSIILLFTDQEESDFQGAQAFIREHPWIKDVKLVINFDAGGLIGPSSLSNTSPDNGWLIREAAKAAPKINASSAYGESRTDFNVFKSFGFSGYAFDYSWNRQIHTAHDNIENLNPPSIQHHGYHALSLARHFGNLDSLEDPKDPNPIYFSFLSLGLVHYPATWVIPISLIVVLVFGGVVVLGFKRQLLTLSGLGLGALVLIISLISSPLLVSVVWKLLYRIAPSYQVTYLGHTINELLLMILFAGITTALTLTWYALFQKIRPTSTPDLTIGALALHVVTNVVFAIAMPEQSFFPAWTGLFCVLAAGYWFYSTNNGSESFSAGQLVALILSTIVAVGIMVPAYIGGFMSSEANDWSLSIVLIVLLLGMLAPQLQIITKPKKLWLPMATWIVSTISFIVTIPG